jgi:protoheme IX farnesyltransferase
MSAATATGRLRDLLELTKPGIVGMNVLMTAGAWLLARGAGDLGVLAAVVVGTGMAVAAANALNMVLERESDRLMARTRRRPLPAGRLGVGTAVAVGLGLGLGALPVLWFWVNPLTAALGAFALASYVLVYTPLKRRTPLALVIGAVPGALPPLMGWTAATGRVDAVGVVLFAVLFAWQLPHFLAIALYRRPDYARAGIRTVVAVRGERVARAQAVAWCGALLPLSLLLVPLGVAGWIYLVSAAGLGGWFLLTALRGLRAEGAGAAGGSPWGAEPGLLWARRLFRVSLLYLPALVLALALDGLVGAALGGAPATGGLP